MNVTVALYDRLAGVSAVTAKLATFDGNPAIFTAWPAPENAARPYLITDGPVSDTGFDYLADTGRDIARDIYMYADNTGSAAAIEALAEAVRAALHRQTMSIQGASLVMMYVTNITRAPTDNSVIGRVLTVRIVAQDQA